MSKSSAKRSSIIVWLLAYAISIFIVTSSIRTTIIMTGGFFLASILCTPNKNIYLLIIVDAIIIGIIFFIAAFVMGIMLKIPQWEDSLINNITYFGVSLIGGNIFFKFTEN